MKGAAFVVAMSLLAVPIGGAQAQPGSKGSGQALAQDSGQGFPNRPLRHIVPFPPGGAADIVGRIMAAALTEVLGQQVIVDNRGGAAGTIGAEIAARATPDGYTLFGCNIASLAISPALYRRLGYDPVADFAPLALLGTTPNVLVVHPSVPATTVAEFIALAKTHPGKINYASAGVGTSPQLSMELLRMTARIDVVHIAYKGAGPAMVDLIGGHVQAMFTSLPSAIAGIRSGKVRAVGVTSKERAPDLPHVLTFAESGMPDFEVISWQGVCTPAAVPQAVLGRLRSDLARVLARPDTRKRLADQSLQPSAMTPTQFAAFIRAERAKWAQVVKDVGIQLQ
jgi:tripartite-type tricarboxylate transporter receptor subunit TctC